MSKIIAIDQYNYIFPLKHSKKETFKNFKKNFDLNIKLFKDNGKSIEFEMINAPFIFHNTIRRLIINEVASVSFNRFYWYMNSSVIEDSDLQLRLALVPLDVDPQKLKFHEGNVLPGSDEDINDFNPETTLLFQLKTDYQKRDYIHKDKIREFVGEEGLSKYLGEIFNKRSDMSVYSDDIKWEPFGDQKNVFNDVKATKGILLNRLMNRESLNIRGAAVKGYGHDHAKFIPTSAAHARMLHNIELKADITGKDAEILKGLYPEGVIEIKNNKAVVANTYLIERAHKNYNEFESLKGKVEMSFNETHYLWKIESVRPINQPANKILVSALNAMIEKCAFYIDNLNLLNTATKDEKTGMVKAQTFGKMLFGKFCYIEIIKPKGNPQFPMFQFIGETATLGACLSYMIMHVFGEDVHSAYSDIPNGISLTLEVVTKKTTKEPSIDILLASLKELSQYFSYIKVYFEKKLSAFVVDME